MSEAARARTGTTCRFDHVYVTVQAVRVYQQSNRGDRWTDVALPVPQRIDLLDVEHGLLGALGVAPLTAGHYTAVRLILADADGSNEVQPADTSLVMPLRTPRAAQAGLLIRGDFVVASGQRGDIALQGFDTCASVLQVGSPGAPRYQLRLDANVEARVVMAPVSTQAERVNSTIPGTQYEASVTRLSDGGYVIVWAQPRVPVSQWCMQRYSAQGTRLGGEACVGSGDLVSQPVVAGLAGGGYAVAWVSTDASGTGIWVAQYGPDGNANGFTQVVNTMTTGDQSNAAIAALTGGGYVIAWTSGNDIFARRFDAGAVPLGTEARVNTYAASDTGGARSGPVVAALADGGYVIAWMSQFQDPARSVGVYMQRFDAAGAPVGGETLVSLQNHTSLNPDVAGLTGGGFVITWQTQASEGSTIVAQQFAPDGSRMGQQATVRPITAAPVTCYVPFPSTCPAENQMEPSVAALDDGGYVISWSSEFRSGGTSGIYARRYDSSGAAAGSAGLVSDAAGRRPAISGTGAGGFVIAWDEWAGIDSDVFARWYGATGLTGATPP
jgi:hypothetical protein